MTPAAALFPLLLLFGSSRPARAFVGPGGPSGGGDRPRALPSAWARAEDVDFDVDGAGRPSATAESKKEKRPRDRAIDRRKSPALWRYDLDYSVAPSASSSSSASASSSGAASSSSGARSPPPVRPRSPPELMSPAGGWPQLKAAVANGADAVYLGLTSYSARARAANFDPDPSLLRSDDGMGEQDRGEESDFGGRLEAAARGGRKADPRDGPPPSKRNAKRDDGAYEPPADGPASLARAVQYCHAHRVRVYVAFNTLVFDAELPEVQDLVEQIWNCGADAIIVQDAGVSRIVKEVVDRLSAKMRAKGLGYDGRGLDGAPLEIHASTQQTVSCADGVKFAAERTNATRVVLGRELSLSEITQISANTDTEIEAFVHGALCVSYSGQCFSSEAWGGRSANRGQCAQACRLPYGLIANGELRHLSFDGIEGIMGGKVGNGGDEEGVGYLLSPQDLCGLEQVEGLVRAGVSCLKIEGRLKDASYVAATTRAYRQAIDAAWAELSSEHSGDAAAVPPPPSRRVLSSSDERVSRRDLTHVFARGQDEVHDGLTPGFFEGPRHQRLVRGRSPRHRGVHVGRVVGAERGALVVALDDDGDEEDGVPLKRGDGVVIDRGRPQEEELGGPIYDVTLRDDGRAVVRFGRDVERRWKDNDRKRRAAPLAPRGAHVWKTSDATTAKRMRKLAELDPPKSPARVVVEGRIGTPLTVRVVDEGSGRAGEASSSNEETLEEAKGSGVGEKSIAKAIGTLGNSRWSLSELDLSGLEEGSWCPMSWVKDARRRALEDLEANFPSARAHPASDVVGDSVVDLLLDEMSRDVHADRPETRAKLSVLARNYEQVDALCNMILSDSESSAEAISEIIVDFLEIDGIRAAVSRIQEAKARSSRDLRVVVASPRVIKPGEEGIWRTLLKTNPDGILVRSAGLLYRLTQLGGAGGRVAIPSPGGETVDVTIPELIGDFSLNAANAIAAHELLRSGLSRITAAYDLSGDAIAELATLLGDKASRLEAVVHQHMPIFHTEHCVFARFLSKGNSYRDCGHVCTRNTVHLRDQGGKDNLVLADMGCRNTVFMAESQSGVASMDQWIRAGIRHLRIELVDESGSDAVKIVSSYLQFLSKEMAADEVWNVLEGIPDSNGRLGGVGVGSLRNSVERRSGEVSSGQPMHS